MKVTVGVRVALEPVVEAELEEEAVELVAGAFSIVVRIQDEIRRDKTR